MQKRAALSFNIFSQYNVMTDSFTSQTAGTGRTGNWRQMLHLMGKDAFIREEMERLGFWPPSDAVGRETEQAEAELRSLYAVLAEARGELAGVENEIREIGDTPRLLAEIRRRRIERVRAEPRNGPPPTR